MLKRKGLSLPSIPNVLTAASDRDYYSRVAAAVTPSGVKAFTLPESGSFTSPRQLVLIQELIGIYHGSKPAGTPNLAAQCRLPIVDVTALTCTSTPPPSLLLLVVFRP